MIEINRRHIKVFSAVLICLLITLAGSYASAADLPSASLPKTKFNFKSVPEGEVVNHDFIIENKGTALLNIYGVSGG